MLKKRVVATIIVNNGIAVQSINFSRYLPIGKPHIAIEFLNQWGIDEIILLDISATKNKSEPDYDMIKKVSLKCHVPLTIGGGITHIDHIKKLMHCGADKISLNQSTIHKPELITEAAKIFGDQCVVISLDGIKNGNSHLVYDYINKAPIQISPALRAKKLQELGAGEIFINSVDRDGSYLGYDVELIHSVCNAVSVPVICCGGARNALDFVKVLNETNVSAVCAANMFHFTEHSVNITKAIIKKHMNVRLETHADYCDSAFDENYRLKKKEDQQLEEMLFVRIEKEVI